MSNELTNWEAELAAEATALANQERPAASSIGLRGGMLSYMGEPVPNNQLPCIVVAQAWEHRYFNTDWDPDNIVPPACFALSAESDPQAPAPESAEPQHDDCATCPQFQWGSDPRPNSRGKACKQVRRLALLPYQPDYAADQIAALELAVLTVPVTSVKGWGQYINMLRAKLQRPFNTVATQISAQPHPKFQFQVLFEDIQPLEMDVAIAVRARVEECNALLTRPYEYTAQEPAEAPPPKGKRKY